MPQNPSGYNPVSFPEVNRRRQLIVLNYMEAQGYISHDTHREAENDPVYDRVLASDPLSGWENVYSYYEDALISQVTDILMQELHYNTGTGAPGHLQRRTAHLLCAGSLFTVDL
ncbi:MAG: hypothetical protein ACLTSZ_18555 [Lachnospiraceae bacterium]